MSKRLFMILIMIWLSGCVRTSYEFELFKEYDVSTPEIRPNVSLKNYKSNKYNYNNNSYYMKYDDLISYHSGMDSDYTVEIRDKTLSYSRKNKQALLDRDDILEIDRRHYEQIINYGGNVELKDLERKENLILNLLGAFSFGIIPFPVVEKQTLEIIIRDNNTGLDVIKPIGALTKRTWYGWIPLFIPNGDGANEAIYKKSAGISANILHHINPIISEKEKIERYRKQEKIEAEMRKKEELKKQKQELDSLLKRFKERTKK